MKQNLVRLFNWNLNRSNSKNFNHSTVDSSAEFNYKRSDQSSKGKLSHPYRNLFPWKTEVELAQTLASNILYRDTNFVAINKPWGLGIHKSQVTLNHKSPAFAEQLMFSQVFGQPKYCVADVLDLLSQILRLPKLYIVRALDRKTSGVLLLSTQSDAHRFIEKSFERAKMKLLPYMRFYCICNGTIPNAETGKSYVERCGIRLTEIDEMGKFKEPIYVSPKEMTGNMRKHGKLKDKFQLGPVKCATVEYRVLARNPKLAVSLVDIGTTTVKWSAVQCFMAYKASFILGDTFFSHRVKHILGQPITMASLKQKRLENWRHLDQNFEPLSKQVCQALKIRSNREIPLMLHHHSLILPRLLRSFSKSKKQEVKSENSQEKIETENVEQKSIAFKSNIFDSTDENDLIVQGHQPENLPKHFLQTLDRLELNIFQDNDSF